MYKRAILLLNMDAKIILKILTNLTQKKEPELLEEMANLMSSEGNK